MIRTPVVTCGIGYSELTLSGDVYNLVQLGDFGGACFSTAVIAVAGKGGFWMKNARCVAIHLSGSSDGAASGFGVADVEIKLAR